MMKQQKTAALALLLAASAAALASAHICVLEPRQRGPLNVTEPGDPSCFRHGAPCGGMPAGAVGETLTGTSWSFTFQQAYNHYQAGFPGYMDLAWAPGPNPADSDFEVLATVGDYNARFQGTARNYTVEAPIPQGVSLDHAVIRARYVPHKTGEAVFYQCADVAIRTDGEAPAAGDEEPAEGDEAAAAAAPPASVAGSLLGLLPQGNGRAAALVSVGVETGVVTRLTVFGGVREAPRAAAKMASAAARHGRRARAASAPVPASAAEVYVLQTAAAVNPATGEVHYLASRSADREAVPDLVATVNPANGNVTLSALGTGLGFAFALEYSARLDELVAAVVEPSGTGGAFQTHIVSARDGKVIDTFAPDNTNLNFQFSTFDGKFNLLMQNENDALNMTSVLYAGSVDEEAGTRSEVTLDVSAYTYEELHWDGTQNVALSPGLGPARPDRTNKWSVLRVDAAAGSAAALGRVEPPAGVDFVQLYTGAVRYGTARRGVLYHIFTLTDGSLRVASIFYGVPGSISVKYSPPLVGITAENPITTLAFYEPSAAARK